MAGRGNVPGESKTKSTNTTITFNLIYSSESVIAGDGSAATSQDKIYGLGTGDSGSIGITQAIVAGGGGDLTDGHISGEPVMRPLLVWCSAGVAAGPPARTRAVSAVA